MAEKNPTESRKQRKLAQRKARKNSNPTKIRKSEKRRQNRNKK